VEANPLTFVIKRGSSCILLRGSSLLRGENMLHFMFVISTDS
jgi:hypothetical protein